MKKLTPTAAYYLFGAIIMTVLTTMVIFIGFIVLEPTKSSLALISFSSMFGYLIAFLCIDSYLKHKS